MSLSSVREFISRCAPELEIIETADSTATVADAARVHAVVPGQIAKTLSLWLGDSVVLLVAAGDARLDNRKFKDRFGNKPKMLDAADVVSFTGHPVGGVCPFGLARELPVYADISLQRFERVIPAAGATNAALSITPQRLVELTQAQWVEVTTWPSLV